MVQVNNLPYVTLRIRFKKLGRLQYISHLDLVRTMSKILVRAKLPMWYTEGFNPKPKMVFAAPLSIGTDSEAEFMDLRLLEHVDPGMVRAKLNACMTREMQIKEAYYPTTPLTELAYLSYEIRIVSPMVTDALLEKVRIALSSDTVVVKKKTKSGERDVDIKGQIREASASLDGDALVILANLSADSASFLNPEYLVTYLKGATGVLTSPDLLSETYSILRKEAYRADMTLFR